jgi:hypothetical protein
MWLMTSVVPGTTAGEMIVTKQREARDLGLCGTDTAVSFQPFESLFRRDARILSRRIGVEMEIGQNLFTGRGSEIVETARMIMMTCTDRQGKIEKGRKEYKNWKEAGVYWLYEQCNFRKAVCP